MSDFMKAVKDAGLAVFTSFLVPLSLAAVAVVAVIFAAIPVVGAAFTTILIVLLILFVVWLILYFILAKKAICGCDDCSKHRHKKPH